MSDVTVSTSGALFNGDAERSLDNGEVAVRRRIAAEGEGLIRANFMATIKHDTGGKFLRSIKTIEDSKVFTTFSNDKSYTMAVVEDRSTETTVTSDLATYGPWLEGTGSRNSSTRFSGYQGFRRATQALNLQASALGEEAMMPFVEEMNR
jgi:hypothetical protein